MKKYIILSYALLGVTLAQAQVGIKTTSPVNTLTVDASTDANNFPTGLQAPRVDFAKLLAKTAYTTDQKGSLVYVTGFTAQNTDPTYTNITRNGYYVFDGAKWVAILNQGDFNGYYWKTTGNTGLTSPNNELGTTQNLDIVFKTNNTETARIISQDNATDLVEAGNLGIGTQKPTEKLDVNGSVLLRQGGAANQIPSDYNQQMVMSMPDGTYPFTINSRAQGGKMKDNTLDFFAADPNSINTTTGAYPTRRMLIFDGAGLGINVPTNDKGGRTNLANSLTIGSKKDNTSVTQNAIRIYNQGTGTNDNAIVGLQVAGENSGDVGLSYVINSFDGTVTGIDNSVNDNFKLYRGWWGANPSIAATNGNPEYGMTLTKDGRMGIHVANPKAKVDVSNISRLPVTRYGIKKVDISLLTTGCTSAGGTVGNLGFTDNVDKSIILYKGTGTTTINQVFMKGGTEGDLVYVYNYSNQTIHFEDGGGCGDTTPANMVVGTGLTTSYDLLPNQGAMMLYCPAPLSKWKIVKLH